MTSISAKLSFRPLLAALSLATLGFSSCSSFARSLDPVRIPYAQAKEPGFFDIGAGFGRISDTRNANDDDASGILVSFKAYPLGRWYAEAQDQASYRGMTDRDKADLRAVLSAEQASKRISNLASPKTDEAFDRSVARLKTMLEKRDVQLPHGISSAVEDAVLGKALSTEQVEELEQVATSPAPSRKWRILEERSSWYNRLSVFYGLSAGDFSGGGLASSVDVVGIGYDISPDLALLLGRGFYDVDDGGGEDSDSSAFFGVSLNLYAFKNFLAAAAGLDTQS